MALSQLSRQYLTNALANKARAKEIADAIDSLHAVAAAAHVANAGTPGAVTIALSTAGGNTYSDAAVNSAVNAALVTTVAEVNSNTVSINAILAALQAAGLMA